MIAQFACFETSVACSSNVYIILLLQSLVIVAIGKFFNLTKEYCKP